jgi:hypothetical protein
MSQIVSHSFIFSVIGTGGFGANGRAVASGRFGLPGWDLWFDGVPPTRLGTVRE